MANVPLTVALRAEYERLFHTCVIRTDKTPQVEALLQRFDRGRDRYDAVETALGIPWYFVAVVHCMEAGLDFTCHLHNGDPLSARTVQVPAGRPRAGSPPFTWEQSATDSLILKKLDSWADWSIAGLLYKLEEFNGWGYRRFHPHVLSPYLWSFSDHYTSGKYVRDGTWSDSAVSQQCGAAVLLRRMAEHGTIVFGDETTPTQPDRAAPPLIRYTTRRPELSAVRALQEFLNGLPDVFVKVDGNAGPRTSAAVKRVFGHYLVGDPRE